MNIERTTTNYSSLSFKNILKVIAIAIVVLTLGYAIAQAEWKYLGVLLVPALIYVSIRKPFIFPFGAYAFFMPFDSISSLTGSEKITTLTKVFGILTILVLILKGTFERKFRKPHPVSLWWLLFIFYGILTIVWADKTDLAIGQVPTAVGLLLLYLVTTTYRADREDYETLKWAILLGGVSASSLAIHGFINGFNEFGRATLIFGGTAMNPNTLSFYMLLPLSICIEKYLKHTDKKTKGLFLALCAVILFCIIISGSRANMTAAGIILIVFIYSGKRRLGLSVGLLMIGIILIQFIPEIFYSRWEKAMSTGGSGRLDIWYTGWKALEKYWLFGIGLLNFPIAYTEFASYAPNFQGINRDAHNIFLAVAVELGILGFILFVLAIWHHYALLKKSYPNGDSGQVMLKASFWAILLSSSFNQRLWEKGFWLIWMMIVIYGNVLRRERTPTYKSRISNL
jgi:O-antigen ligase